MSFIRILASICLMALPAAAQPGPPNAEGIWEIANDAGSPTGWFKIYMRNGVYEGQIVKVLFAPGEDAATLLCTACQGVQKDAPALGLTFMTGMKKDGLAYENGRILNPLNGQLYRARMVLSEDGASLVVQVYLTAEKLGEPRIWSRVSENSETRQLMAMPVKD